MVGRCKQCRKAIKQMYVEPDTAGLCRKCAEKVLRMVPCPVCGVPRPRTVQHIWNRGLDVKCAECQRLGHDHKQPKPLIVLPPMVTLKKYKLVAKRPEPEPKPKPKPRRCNRCDEWFVSEDDRRFHFCPACRKINAHQSEDLSCYGVPGYGG